MRFLYDIAFFIFSLFYLPIFFLKGKWNQASLSRFGILPDEVVRRLKERPVLWVHAVSVGEMGMAVGFVNRLREDQMDAQFLLTTTTVTGHEVGQKIKNEEDVLLYFPADFRFAVRSFVAKIAPSVVILFETEIWPNLIWELSEKKVPVLLLNGRISDRAFIRYRRVRPFLKKILNRLSAIGAQDERMRERFIALGADPERVTLTGNLKFDGVPLNIHSESLSDLRHFCRRPSEFLWVAGSTHEGEEEKLFEVYSRLRVEHEKLRLLIAPRHLHRVPDIEKQAFRKGIRVRKISSQMTLEEDPGDPKEVWILDQMGILGALYEIADAVFVGGSLVPAGGHNLVEPAFFKKAILFGPCMQNFLEMATEFKKNNAALEVRDPEDLQFKLKSLITDPERRYRLGEAAERLVKRHQGATESSRGLLMKYWQTRRERKLVSA